jgi:hypothetical protein
MTGPGRGRVRELLAAALVDSFGLALGWTLFTLLALERAGLSAAALYNAAMFVGVMLSAPATGWLAGRLSGRALIAGAAIVEMALRVLTLVGLLAGWPVPVLAAGVVAMYVAAWAGYAGMRAEVAAVDGRSTAMTRYAMCVAALEAAGAGMAALLPAGDGLAIAGVAAIYAGGLVPTLISARRARVPSTRTAVGPAASTRPRPRMAVALRPQVAPLAAGALVMLVASGPTLLSVALAADLYGPASVFGAAVAFGAGSLLSAPVVRIVSSRVPAAVAWPLWGMGMLAGWVVAPYHVAGLLLAQLLAGISLTAFEGVMDARIARDARHGTVTAMLAWSASVRAMGSAVAVRMVPIMVAAPAVGALSAAGASTLVLVALVAAVSAGRAQRSVARGVAARRT